MQEVQMNLVNKTREAGLAKNRSVSFNGVSVMVDAIMNVYHSISKDKKSELSIVVDNNNIDPIRYGRSSVNLLLIMNHRSHA